jgi:squalene-hopene/tetraprenyl-beta-curcumene cyclase
VDLDPWEHAESAYFGAALAALAADNAGAEHTRSAPVASHLAALTSYLRDQSPARRPLHDRLALLWASTKRRELLSDAERKTLVAEVLGKQQPDGGWTNESLGPWTPHPDAPAVPGSSSFATAFTTFVLQRAAVSSSDPRLARALRWLITHQHRETGAWPALSMNKRYPAGSMQSLFMQDAATAFASLALIEAGR